MALGGALFEQIRFKGGKITNPRFSDYRVPRFADTPKLETVLVNRPDARAMGAGETAVTVVAAAIANAVYDATGARIRQVPFTPERVKAALAART